MQIQSTKCLFIKGPCLVLWIVSASCLSQRERDMSRSVQQQTGSLILIFCLCRRCRASREKISINSTNASLSLDFAIQCSESFETTLFAILCQHQSLVVISLVKPSWKCGIRLNAITLFSAYCSYPAHFSLSTHFSLHSLFFLFIAHILFLYFSFSILFPLCSFFSFSSFFIFAYFLSLLICLCCSQLIPPVLAPIYAASWHLAHSRRRARQTCTIVQSKKT